MALEQLERSGSASLVAEGLQRDRYFSPTMALGGKRMQGTWAVNKASA